MSEIAEENVEQYVEAVEHVVESLTKLKVSYAAMGVSVGVAAGAMLGFVIAYRKAEKKYNHIAEEEIAGMREHYHAKLLATENRILKPELEKIINDQGYSTEPPMGITPPTAVVEAAEAAKETEIVAEEVEEVDTRPEHVRNLFKESKPTYKWDYHEEKTRRSPHRPYVIHFDERGEKDYEDQILTWYEADDVLCRDDDSIIDGAERERLVGERNLDRFGHGSGDVSIVFIRNDTLEAEYEICKSPNSYAEEVHGLSHSVEPRRRGRFDDDDEGDGRRR